MFSCKSDSTLSPFPLVDAPKPASYLEPVCSKCSCWHEHEVRHAAADNTSGKQKPDIGRAPPGQALSQCWLECCWDAGELSFKWSPGVRCLWSELAYSWRCLIARLTPESSASFYSFCHCFMILDGQVESCDHGEQKQQHFLGVYYKTIAINQSHGILHWIITG